MLNYMDLKTMSAALRETINRCNYDEACGIQVAHSYKKIIEENREPAIAARMTSRPFIFNRCTVASDGSITLGVPTKYSGADIANIIIESVQKSKMPICYPLTGGNWSKSIIRQLYLLIKGKAVARFEVKSIEPSTQLTVAELMAYTDPTPILHCTFKSVAYITNVTTENLPQDFLGNYSGLPIKDSALKGSSPLIYIL
jgi:hypothetical protein